MDQYLTVKTLTYVLVIVSCLFRFSMTTLLVLALAPTIYAINAMNLDTFIALYNLSEVALAMSAAYVCLHHKVNETVLALAIWFIILALHIFLYNLKGT